MSVMSKKVLAPCGTCDEPQAVHFETAVALDAMFTLAREVEALEKRVTDTAAFAAHMLGQACEAHQDAARQMDFATFKAQYEALGCHWCEHERAIKPGAQ